MMSGADGTAPTPLLGDVAYSVALADQPRRLATAVVQIAEEVSKRAVDGTFTGAGPIFTGIGASHAAACAAVWSLRSRGIESFRVCAGDVPLPYPRGDQLVIGVSQSGRSAETLALLGSVATDRIYAVVNHAPSPIVALAGRHLPLGNLPDSYASTIGFTATEAALGMIADVWNGGSVNAGWKTIGRQLEAVQEQMSDRVEALSALFDSASSVDFVGAGAAIGTAEESALLFREVARIHATGTSTRQYLHGMMESAGGGVHVLFGDEREIDVACTLARAGHTAIVVTPVMTGGPPSDAPIHTITIPPTTPAQRAILEVGVIQQLVQAVAGRRGVDIEKFVFHNSDTKVDRHENRLDPDAS